MREREGGTHATRGRVRAARSGQSLQSQRKRLSRTDVPSWDPRDRSRSPEQEEEEEG